MDVDAERIDRAWDAFEGWLAQDRPELLSELRPGASAEEIAQAEAALGVAFPEELKALYRRHDGQRSDRYQLFDGAVFLSLSSMIVVAQERRNHDPDEVKRGVAQLLSDLGPIFSGQDLDKALETPGMDGLFGDAWPHDWIPFASDAPQRDLFLRLDDGAVERSIVGGAYLGVGNSHRLAPSLAKWFEGYAVALAAGYGHWNSDGVSLHVDVASFQNEDEIDFLDAGAPDADSDAARVTRAWESLEAWLRMHRPEALSQLNPGASDADIAALEAASGFAAPDDVKAFYRRHDGAEVLGLIDGFDLMSLDEIAEEWPGLVKDYSSPDIVGGLEPPSWTPKGVKRAWWAEGWMPIAKNGGGDYFFIDLDPAPGGRVGQIVHFWHDVNEMPLLGRSFAGWFERYVERIHAGEVVWDDEYGGFMDAD